MSTELRLVVISVLICCTFCYAQETTVDCSRLFDEHMKNKDLSAAADQFISSCNDAEAIAFLQGRIGDPNSSKLAMISLAKLAPTSQAAKDVLYDSIYAGNGSGMEALGYLEPDMCGILAKPLLIQSGVLEVRKPAAEILGATGDATTVEMLKTARYTTGEKSRLRRAIDSAITKLQYKLASVPFEEQHKWSREDLLLWRILRETPDLSRIGSAVYGEAAMAVKEQGRRISRSLLEYKVISEDLMGIALVGAQREAWAVEQLAGYATRGDNVGDFSRTALMNIGTPEAVAALQNSLLPDGSNRANVNIIMMLSLMGGREFAAFLKTLAQNDKFSEKDRRRMNTAVRVIEHRLARQ